MYLLLTGAALPAIWRIPLVVGTVLTVVNQGPSMRQPSLATLLAVVVNYLTPYVVSSLGWLRAQPAMSPVNSKDHV
ncbi:MAG: hypothetical protein AAF962_08725 [Actinomycetota bacterium]